MGKTNTSDIVRSLHTAGISPDKIELVTKAIPSSPSWYSLRADFGFWNADREEMLALLATYQKNPIIHGSIGINAKGITQSKPCLMRTVNKDAKNLQQRGLKKLSPRRLKRIRKHWLEPALNRKSFSDDNELVEVVSHPLLDALHSTEQDQSFHNLLRLTVINLDIFGISFWQKIRGGMGEVTSYRYLPAWNVTPQRGSDGMITGWYYCSSYGDAFPLKEPVAKEDMLVIRWPSLSDPHAGGDSPLKSALDKIALSGKWTDYQNWLLNNRARPDGVITVAEEVGPDLASREEKRFNDKFRGPGNGRLLVTSGKFTPISYAPTDLAPLAFDEALTDAVLFALDIPKSFTTHDSNKATMEASLEQWARQGLAPRVALLESALNQLASEYEDNLIWVFENVIPEDRVQELAEETFEVSKWNEALASGAVTKNEYREIVLGLEPLPEEEPEEDPETLDEEVEDNTPEEEEEAEDVAEDQPNKSFNLLQLNTKVAEGILDRCTAINMVVYSLKLPEREAEKLVTHPKKLETQEQNGNILGEVEQGNDLQGSGTQDPLGKEEKKA